MARQPILGAMHKTMAKKSVKILIIIFGIIITFAASAFLLPNFKEKFSFIFRDISGKIRQTKDLFGAVEACYSSDGINITKKKAVANLFGMTGGIRLKDGTILITGIDFADRNGITDTETGNSIKDVGFYQSQNGWDFTKFKPKITNLSRTLMAWGDPVIIDLPEGGYRMYFTERIDKNTPPNLVSAYSQDGYNYTFEDKVTGAPGINLDAVDFTAFYEKNAKKYYIYTRAENPNEAYVLESNDGRYFNKRYKISIPFSFQFSVIDEDNQYIAYGGHISFDNKPGSNLRYPVRAISADGLNWKRSAEQPNGPWMGDRLYCGVSAVFKLPDGYYFY